MDTLDPLLFNSIAKSREIIVYDSIGLGHSEGSVPDSIPEMASVHVKILAALVVSKADFIGFSMGGAIVQTIEFHYPQIVNKLILAGTQSGIGEGVALPPREYQRIHERKVEGEERKGYLVGAGAQSQLAAIFKFAADTHNFDRLADIKAPVLVTNGHTDIMSPTANSFVLQQRIANAQLHLYPDAGHGHLFQVPELYAKQLELFLRN
ncbi:alpha/beta fold hydrolase [Aspergillus affinis]|uniref:alpha/beta fold hydrolase n=1 Tax=Aspergillus affinis TaxID=1070780 RepID=UPI0022FDDA39|nr:uncharacterized protein KD926_002650 [Aspergillus affinis]KAI9035896.1 hypothetical protein KD926_002650 [Aspergillus affinis]